MRHILLTLALTGTSLGQGPGTFKQVAAGPEEIRAGVFDLPDRQLLPERIAGRLVQVDESGVEWLPGQGSGSVVLLGVGESLAGFRVEVPGASVPIQRLFDLGLAERFEAAEGSEGFGRLARERIEVQWPLRSPLVLAAPKGQTPWTLIGDGSDAVLEFGVEEYELVQGAPVTAFARLGGGARILEAVLGMEGPGGAQSLPMECAGGESWQVALPTEQAGDFVLTTRVRAITDEGQAIERIGRQALTIAAPSIVATGPAQVSVLEDGAWALDLPIVADVEGERIQVSAQVWGTDASGEGQPACWLGRMADVAVGAGTLRFELDPRYLVESGLQAPIELRELRIQHPRGWSVLWQQAAWPVLGAPMGNPSTMASPAGGLRFRSGGQAMTLGGSTPDAQATALFGLMLAHGWCSSGGVWPVNQFDGPLVVFDDPNANRSHDEFAQLLLAAGSGKRSYGVVGHSQGGCAALHLLTYYTSGLDLAAGGRRIQSLATPYQGTPLASLGFVLCGNNSDMTPSGSAAWLANIPLAVRDEVDYYTTSNSGSACSLLTDFFLSNPEDGTVEQSRGQLPGAHNMGHTLGWCHTTGMSNPAGYTDASRNTVLSAMAAR
ncbi:MAG: hypothetical protein R3F33_00725 [Planctomycetota bacterium]